MSSDKTATSFGSSEVFLQNLYHQEKLAVKITPYMSAPLTALFDLTGFEQAMEPLRDACGWAGATFIEGRVSFSTDPVRFGMIKHIGTEGATTAFSPAIPGADQLIQTCAQPGNERVCYIKGRVVDRQLVEVFSVRAE